MIDEEWWQKWLNRARALTDEYAKINQLKGKVETTLVKWNALCWDEYRQPEHRCVVKHRVGIYSASDGDAYVTCEECGQVLFVAWQEVRRRP